MPIEQIRVTLVDALAGHKRVGMFETLIPIDPYFPPLPPLSVESAKLGTPIISLLSELKDNPESITTCCKAPLCKITGSVDVPMEMTYRDKTNTNYNLADLHTFDISVKCRCSDKGHIQFEAMAKPELVYYRFINDYSALQVCVGLYLMVQYLTPCDITVPSEGLCPIPADCGCGNPEI